MNAPEKHKSIYIIKTNENLHSPNKSNGNPYPKCQTNQTLSVQIDHTKTLKYELINVVKLFNFRLFSSEIHGNLKSENYTEI